jgi:hypothetical protein
MSGFDLPTSSARCSPPVFHDRTLLASTIALGKLGDSHVHTPAMTLKNAALLALIGTILATVLLVWTLVFNFVNVLRGLAPPVMLFPWFSYAFACFSLTVFSYVFHRAQS